MMKLQNNSALKYHGLNIQTFYLYTKENPQILYRIITIQILLIKKIFGESIWEIYKESRNNITIDEQWNILSQINPVLFDLCTDLDYM